MYAPNDMLRPAGFNGDEAVGLLDGIHDVVAWEGPHTAQVDDLQSTRRNHSRSHRRDEKGVERNRRKHAAPCLNCAFSFTT